jgi:hypothetical protein
MYEQVLSTSIRSNKTITFFLIEPFYFALAQFLISLRLRLPPPQKGLRRDYAGQLFPSIFCMGVHSARDGKYSLTDIVSAGHLSVLA